MDRPDCVIMVPSRGRPVRLAKFLDQADETRRARTQFRVILDEDDAGQYDGVTFPPWCAVTVRRRAWLTEKLNRAAMPAAEHAPVVGWLADDTCPVTPGWDALLLEALERDGPGVAFGHGSRRPGFPEHQLVSSSIVRALGWYFEPSMRHYYTDNVWADLSGAAGCARYVPDAVIRHDHYEVTGAPRDETYIAAEVNGRFDREAYLVWRTRRFRQDAQTVRQAIDKSTKAG